MSLVIDNPSQADIDQYNALADFPRRYADDGTLVSFEPVNGELRIPDAIPTRHRVIHVPQSWTELADCSAVMDQLLADAGSDLVVFPPGIYRRSSQLQLNGKNLACLQRFGATIRLTDGAGKVGCAAVLKNQGGSCIARNIVFDAGGAEFGVRVHWTSGCRFERCAMINATRAALLLDAANRSYVHYCTMRGVAATAEANPGAYGVLLVGATNSLVEGAYIRDCEHHIRAIGNGANGSVSRATDLQIPVPSGTPDSTFDAGYVRVVGGTSEPAPYDGGHHAIQIGSWFSGTSGGGGVSGNRYLEGCLVGARLDHGAANLRFEGLRNATGGSTAALFDLVDCRNVVMDSCMAVAGSTPHILYDAALGSPVAAGDPALNIVSIPERQLVARDCVIDSINASNRLEWAAR